MWLGHGAPRKEGLWQKMKLRRRVGDTFLKEIRCHAKGHLHCAKKMNFIFWGVEKYKYLYCRKEEVRVGRNRDQEFSQEAVEIIRARIVNNSYVWAFAAEKEMSAE